MIGEHTIMTCSHASKFFLFRKWKFHVQAGHDDDDDEGVIYIYEMVEAGAVT